MVFCGFHMKKVKRNTCLYCKESGAPDHCLYREREPEQANLKGLFG